jgi:hypothetical protein
MAFPRFDRYLTLVTETRSSLLAMRIDALMVDENGAVANAVA